MKDKLLVAAVWLGMAIAGWALVVGIIWSAIWVRDTRLMPLAAVAVGLLGVYVVYKWDRA